MTKDTNQRKRDHLRLAQDKSLQFKISAGFEKWRFVHNALPELDLHKVDTACSFLGKQLSFPLLISSMSGGPAESAILNQNLGYAAEKTGVGLALGSMRPALESQAARESFLVARSVAPSIPICANLGISQAMDHKLLPAVETFCEELQAQGLFLHLNPLQEAFQVEGDTHFKGALETIAFWVREFSLPILVKEVGQGLSHEVIQRLEGVGVQFLDIAGAGGSNWIQIEAARLPESSGILRSVAHEFRHWGEPTAQILESLETQATIIASGGVREPMDLPKALALGAGLVALAGPLLQAGLQRDPGDLIRQIHVWQQTLKHVLFGIGLPNISALIGNRKVLKKIRD